MEKNRLSGIERELVLQYLTDGNVPVTLTPEISGKDSDNPHPLGSAVFPVALKAEKIKADKTGLIQLVNPPQSVLSLKKKNVKVKYE